MNNQPMTESGNAQENIKPLSTREILHQTALKAPGKSGVYMWRNQEDTVIYVGKAKNLKNRLSSYFSGNKDIKTRLLISSASSIEYITTENEYEAFLLENNLIKKYTPRYNINLKDGKSYPVLCITKEEYPRIFKTRRVIHNGSAYFGPYPDASALDAFIDALYEIYPLRHCKKFKKQESPCMYYHIHKCLAPCCKKNTDSTYTEYIEEIKALLENKDSDSLKKIENLMKESAKSLNFEKAARLRDGLRAINVLTTQNIVESFDSSSRDYIASWSEGELISFTVLKIRGGKLLGRDNYRAVSLNEEDEILPEFISAYYTEKDEIPPSIYVINSKYQDLLERYFAENFGVDCRIHAVNDSMANASYHKASINMAQQNAREDIIRRVRERGDYPAMEELQKVLGLDHLPVRIEGFDIAHIGGKFPVASLISFYNGNPDKKNYRYFRLKTTDGYIDDFASMREATSRRYSRLLNEGKELPDLILIDGGIGQVNAVDGVLKSLGLDIPIAGLAKRDEEIWRPYASGPVCLPKKSEGLRLLQRVRDETHRFATSRNQELRTKENTVSPFTKIPGIGPKRDKTLTVKFGTLERLQAARPEEISRILDVALETAVDIRAEAEKLYIKEKSEKETAMLSLDTAGTTKQKAARYKINENLAAAALEAAEP